MIHKFLNNKNLLTSHFFWFVIILIIAAIPRIFFLDLIEFKFDEAFNVYQVAQFYQNPVINFHSGISSSGIHNFPLLNYLLIILGFFSHNPQYLSFLIALINTILVGTFYLIVKKFYGNLTGVYAGLLLASSPWAILYSRKIWHPDLILLFAVPIFYILNKLFLSPFKKSKLIFGLFLLLTLLSQQHFSGFYLLFLTPIFLKIYQIKFSFKQMLLGILMGLIPTIPYILFNLSSNPFCYDCHALFDYGKQVRVFDLNNFLRPLQIANGSYFDNVLGFDYPLFLASSPILNIFNYFFVFEYLIPILGLILILKYQRKYLFIVFYSITIPVIYFLTKNPPRMHYFVIFLPWVILLYGLFFKFFWDKTKRNIFRIIIITVITFLIIINFIFIFSFYNFLALKKNINGDYGPIYSETEKYLNEETKQYALLPYFDELKVYAGVFAKPEIIHGKLAEFFLQKGQINLATLEYQKALVNNPADITSLVNLTYIYLQTGNLTEGEKQLNILSQKESTVSAKLKDILENLKKQELR